MSESQHTEYKQSWHDDYLKWANGGVLYIGKDDKGQVVHLKDYETLMEKGRKKIHPKVYLNAYNII